VQNLLHSPSNKIHATAQQGQAVPYLPKSSTAKQSKSLTPAVHDVSLIANCIRGAKSHLPRRHLQRQRPGCSLAQHTTAVVAARPCIVSTRGGPDFKIPKLVLLSSATIDATWPTTCLVVRPVMLRAAVVRVRRPGVAETALARTGTGSRPSSSKPRPCCGPLRATQLTLDDEESASATWTCRPAD